MTLDELEQLDRDARNASCRQEHASVAVLVMPHVGALIRVARAAKAWADTNEIWDRANGNRADHELLAAVEAIEP